MSRKQVDEKIIPAIVDLDVPLVTSSRLRKVIKAMREGARVASERNRRVTVEDQNVPLPSEELKRSGSLPFSRSKFRFSADEDAGETVVRRLKCQLNKQCIRFENIMETKTRERETAETRVRHTELGNRTELRECEEPERKQPKTIAAEAYLDVLWTYTSAWPEQASRNFKTDLEQPRPMRCRRTTMNIPSNIHSLSNQSEAFTASLPRDCALPSWRRLARQKRCCGPRGFKDQKHAWSFTRSGWGERTLGSGTRNQGKGSQQQQHSHHQPPSSIGSQTSLPELWAHGQQRI